MPKVRKVNSMKVIRASKRNEAHSRAAWEIRNHPQNRPFMNNVDEIPFEAHERWYKAYKGLFLLLQDGKELIGYLRFEPSKVSYASIAIHPDHQGKGAGTYLLKKALREYKKSLPKVIFAEIKKENKASQRLFEKCGFLWINETDEARYYFILP